MGKVHTLFVKMHEILSDTAEYFFRWRNINSGYGLRNLYLLKLGHRYNAIPKKILMDFCER